MSGADAQAPGFGERSRMRRRARFLRKARELALRDLGGFVFDMHRFGHETSDALSAKLATLRLLDAELRALEGALGKRQGLTVLREVGIAACPRCAAIHGRDDRFCPGCGLPFDSHAERPIATAPMSIPGPPPSAPAAAAPDASPAAPTSMPIPTPTPAAAAPPSPPIGATAPPVAARPKPAEPDRDGEEDRPTEILRPPLGGG